MNIKNIISWCLFGLLMCGGMEYWTMTLERQERELSDQKCLLQMVTYNRQYLETAINKNQDTLLKEIANLKAK